MKFECYSSDRRNDVQVHKNKKILKYSMKCIDYQEYCMDAKKCKKRKQKKKVPLKVIFKGKAFFYQKEILIGRYDYRKLVTSR